MSDAFSRIIGRSNEPEEPTLAITNASGDAFSRIVGGNDPATQPGAIDFNQPKAVVRKMIKALPKGQRKAAMKQWADNYVANERKNGGAGQYVNDVVRNLTRGTVVGSWLDEANAATASAQNALGLGGAPYDEAVAYQRATDRAIDNESTKLGTLPVVGDVTVGGVQKVAGGIASAPITAGINVVRGATMLPRIVNGAVNGMLAGGVYGAGLGENAQDRAEKGLAGAAIGTVGGAAIPAIAAGGSRVLNSVRNRAPLPAQLQNFDRRAVQTVSDAVQQDGITPRRLANAGVPNDHGTVTSLGPQGMIADLGQNTSSLAGGIMKRQGTGARIASQAIRDRRRGAQGRIDRATTETLGPAINTVQSRNLALNSTRSAARPHYDEFYNGPVVRVTPNLARALEGAATTPAFQQALNSMRRRNLPVNFETGQNVNQFLDRLRRRMSSLANKAGGSQISPGDRDLASEYNSIARTINSEIDSFLDPQMPGLSSYARARRISGEGLQYESGVEYGQRSISNNVSPNQVEADMAQMPVAEQLGLREGMRRGLRDIAETATTQYGRQPTAGIRQMIGPQARQKIAMAAPAGRHQPGLTNFNPIFNAPRQPVSPANINPRIAAPTMAPQQLARTIDQEAWFNRLYSKGVQNSQANANANAQRVLPAQPGDLSPPTYRNATTMGLSLETGTRLLNALRSSSLSEANDRVVADMARMLVAQGGDRQAIAQGLIQFSRSQNLTGARLQRLEGVVQMLMQGSQPAATNSMLAP